MTAVSIVIPCYNDAETVGQLIRSIVEDAAFTPNDEVIVVDDGSSDGSAQVAARAGARVVVMERNSGPAAARNRGVATAKNDVIFFLDGDTRLQPGTLAAVKEHFSRPGASPCVNGLCDPEPLRQGFGRRYKGLVEYSWHVELLESGQPLTIFNTRVGAMRRATFVAAGGFSERFQGAELEEHEFSYRLPKGTVIPLDGRIRVRHDFPDFLGTVRVYWKRAAKWAELFTHSRRFDNTGTAGTSAGNGLGHVLGALFPPLLLLSAVHPLFAVPGLAALGLFVWMYRQLFRLALAHGLAFSVEIFLFHLIYSYVIVGGVILGFLRTGFSRRLRNSAPGA